MKRTWRKSNAKAESSEDEFEKEINEEFNNSIKELGEKYRKELKGCSHVSFDLIKFVYMGTYIYLFLLIWNKDF